MNDEFKISKKVQVKLKDKEWLKKQIAKGKTAQEILGFSNEAMEKFSESAFKLLENRREEDALNAFVFLVTLNPYHFRYWLGLGLASQLTQDYEAAIDAYEMAAACELENPFPYFYLAKCLFAIHDRPSALQAIELAIEYAEGKDEFLELLSQAHQAKKILLRR